MDICLSLRKQTIFNDTFKLLARRVSGDTHQELTHILQKYIFTNIYDVQH